MQFVLILVIGLLVGGLGSMLGIGGGVMLIPLLTICERPAFFRWGCCF